MVVYISSLSFLYHPYYFPELVACLQADWALNNIDEVKQQREAARASVSSMEAKLQEVWP